MSKDALSIKQKSCLHLQRKPGHEAGEAVLTVPGSETRDGFQDRIKVCAICTAMLSHIIEDMASGNWDHIAAIARAGA